MSYQLGKWKVQCDRCGGVRLNTQVRKEWTGLRVCSNCFEERHPQDHVRGKPDRQAPPWVRPFQDGTDVSPGSGNEITEDDL